MINFFTLGLNQFISLAEQMQRLESELFRIFLRNISASTERMGALSRMGGNKMIEITQQTAEEAEEGMAQMQEAIQPSVSSRAKAGSSRSKSKAQPKRSSQKH